MSYLEPDKHDYLGNEWVRGGIGCLLVVALLAVVVIGIEGYFAGLS
jgi:hypothetical protein